MRKSVVPLPLCLPEIAAELSYAFDIQQADGTLVSRRLLQ